jgi:hypothetical protein
MIDRIELAQQLAASMVCDHKRNFDQRKQSLKHSILTYPVQREYMNHITFVDAG